MMMFGFEVDTLEVSLREQLDMVDTVFLVEATTTTKGVSITRTILKNSGLFINFVLFINYVKQIGGGGAKS